MKTQIAKLLIFNLVIGSMLSACTKDDRGIGDVNKSVINTGENPPNFTETAKDINELTSAGENEDEYRGAIVESKDVKIDSRLSAGDTRTEVHTILGSNNILITQEATSKVLSTDPKTIQIQDDVLILLAGKQGTGKRERNCTLEDEVSGAYRDTQCDGLEYDYAIADFEEIIKKISETRSCYLEGEENFSKAVLSYGAYKLSDGRTLKAMKYVSKTKGKVVCYTALTNETVEVGPGSSTKVIISSPGIPSFTRPANNANATLYFYSVTALDNGERVSTQTTEMIK